MSDDPVELAPQQGRLNQLERDAHTMEYRVKLLEAERLAPRMANVEQVVAQVKLDVTHIEGVCVRIQENTARQVRSFEMHQRDIKTTLRTAAFLWSVVLVVMQFIPYLAPILRAIKIN